VEAKTGTGSRALQNGQIYLQIIIYLIYNGKITPVDCLLTWYLI